MNNLLSTVKYNIKYHMFIPFICGIILLSVSPFIIGVELLDQIQTAIILERYVVFLGLVILTPIFGPELDRSINDLVCSKKLSHTNTLAIRTIVSIMYMLILISVYLVILLQKNCVFDYATMLRGAFSGCIFIGGLAMFAVGLSNSIVIGYMVGFAYYIANYGGDKYLKDFYLFTMSKGVYDGKGLLLIAGLSLIFISISLKKIKYFINKGYNFK